MTALLVVVFTVSAAGGLWWLFTTPLPRWPAPRERLHECRRCCVSYTQAWQLDDHNTFHHPRPDVEAGKNGVTVLRGYRLGGGS